MIQLEPHKGIPRHVLLMMTVMASFTVANLYYNQPLLELISSGVGITQLQANLITVITQVGYILGLLFVIPLADMVSVRRITVFSMTLAAASSLLIAMSDNVWLLWGASLLLGLGSIVPQLFIPVTTLYSLPENKSRNLGYVASGIITGTFSARLISGFVGEWFGWRVMFVIAAVVMVVGLIVILSMMPRVSQNFHGSYCQLMRTVAGIFIGQPRIRLYALRSACAFGSMMAIWACLAFLLAAEPFCSGSDVVGLMGLCGIVGSVAASGAGKYVPKAGILRMSLFGACLQLLAWGIAWLLSSSYTGIIMAIILVGIGGQCLQIANQSGSLQQMPEATNRVNTIFMSLLFVGGSLGTFCAGLGWEYLRWNGVCLVGIGFTLLSLILSGFEIKTSRGQNK